jgi:hypothetical protein
VRKRNIVLGTGLVALVLSASTYVVQVHAVAGLKPTEVELVGRWSGVAGAPTVAGSPSTSTINVGGGKHRLRMSVTLEDGGRFVVETEVADSSEVVVGQYVAFEFRDQTALVLVASWRDGVAIHPPLINRATLCGDSMVIVDAFPTPIHLRRND